MILRIIATAAALGLQQPAQATPLNNKVFAAWLGEIEYLDAVCGSLVIPSEARSRMITEAGLATSDFEQGGTLFSFYLTGKTYASDRFASLPQSDVCFYLQSALGADGYITSQIISDE